MRMLSECSDDITQHLASCHLSNSTIPESELILARAGYFDLSFLETEKMMICPNHRHSLGRYWRAPRTCRYPGHSGPRKKCKDRHAINVAMAKSVQMIFNVTVEIGSREYYSFDCFMHACIVGSSVRMKDVDRETIK